ncbi:MAG: hypothetical protein A2X12_04070 [Bacteroidetes bacterium GWE2_29_8]|nr:MAG: hypothetical protein A2X12_04070 [Bacteroidetes bacterium GWE2_29_8]OFY24953.1 MAG: hypothetical protein A2X02_07920 [Bacteroidetes bacterium GWF2_29_10]
MKNTLNIRSFAIISVIFAGILFRFIPHYPNFTPIAAIALFSGAFLNKKYLAYFIPLIIMFLSDLIIGFHSTMIFVYLSIAITVLMGNVLLKKIKTVNVVGASLLSSSLFFIITNFGMWATTNLYPKDFNGLLQAYTMAIPFFNNGIMGDAFYSLLILGAFSFVDNKYLKTNIITNK